MPAMPVWFHRVDRILTELNKLETSFLDRRAIEKLFGVGERRSRQIMAGLPGLQVGNAFAIERQALIARLENITSGDRFQWEIARRVRLAETLDLTRRQFAAGHVRIAVSAESNWRQIADLSPSITFTPNKLEIAFQDAQDLLKRLFELSQAIANDYETFHRVLAE